MGTASFFLSFFRRRRHPLIAFLPCLLQLRLATTKPISPRAKSRVQLMCCTQDTHVSSTGPVNTSTQGENGIASVEAKLHAGVRLS